ncbi:hypothetical protein [Hydrogenivirga sp. 128-5-R1-1]|uniref:hypothetical protein n=1 Tax=Hydrogenivirga sp. 128-5-R1-1 TaxID=392423 RepID=UPI00015EF13D|nr:hypothetical protein [Hydrogenivirga sp. 128-5-R1-1]EDP74693.1 hypothetical protein HG1285_14814 [Hydrogenivirga sp. 128-5-R1-1]
MHRGKNIKLTTDRLIEWCKRTEHEIARKEKEYREKLLFLEKALERGYEVNMVYVTTQDPRINAGRVAKRVVLGGHPVPPDKIYSRYRTP